MCAASVKGVICPASEATLNLNSPCNRIETDYLYALTDDVLNLLTKFYTMVENFPPKSIYMTLRPHFIQFLL